MLAVTMVGLALATGSVAVASPAKPPVRAAKQDWTRIVRQTPAGNFVVGNPQAAVKLVEYMSFTCPHCAHFSSESAAVLKGQMVRSGSTSFELRPIVRDQIDLGATLLARCGGAKDYFAAVEQLFARQDDWLPLGFNFMEREAKRFALATPLEQVRAGAQSTGLVDLARARGLTDARMNVCFADQKALAQMLAVGEDARKRIAGTPTFFVNDQKVEAGGWAQLEPILRAKGAR